jgi:hypothetical protein
LAHLLIGALTENLSSSVGGEFAAFDELHRDAFDLFRRAGVGAGAA